MCIFVLRNKCCHLVCHMSHPWLFSRAPFSMSISSSSSNLYYHTTRTLLYILNIFKITRSTSYAIKNHSGVKNCRVAETPAQQLPQVMSPKNLIEDYSGDPYQLYGVQKMKISLEKMITKLVSLKKWRNVATE